MYVHILMKEVKEDVRCLDQYIAPFSETRSLTDSRALQFSCSGGQ